MLKNRKAIDILEKYCGEFADQFEWVAPRGAPQGVREYIVSTILLDRFKLEVTCFLEAENPQIDLKFYSSKRSGGSITILESVFLSDPDGCKKIEDKINYLLLAFKAQEPSPPISKLPIRRGKLPPQKHYA